MARPKLSPGEETVQRSYSLPRSYADALAAYGETRQEKLNPSEALRHLIERAGLVQKTEVVLETVGPPGNQSIVATVTRELSVAEQEKVKGSAAWKRRMIATGQAAKIAAWEKDQEDF